MGAAFRKIGVRKEAGEDGGEDNEGEAAAGEAAEAEGDEGARELDPDKAPLVRVPVGSDGKTRLVRFLPEHFLEVGAYQELLAHAQKFGIGEEEVQVLFLKLCSPYDVSLGTVQLKRFFREFDPRFRKLLRRLVLQRARGLPRMLFEDVARFMIDLSAMDYGALVHKTLSESAARARARARTSQAQTQMEAQALASARSGARSSTRGQSLARAQHARALTARFRPPSYRQARCATSRCSTW